MPAANPRMAECFHGTAKTIETLEGTAASQLMGVRQDVERLLAEHRVTWLLTLPDSHW